MKLFYDVGNQNNDYVLGQDNRDHMGTQGAHLISAMCF